MSPKLIDFLSDFQKSLASVITEQRMKHLYKSKKGFFNGNLVEDFLKLSIPDMESVIKGLEVIVKFYVIQLFRVVSNNISGS